MKDLSFIKGELTIREGRAFNQTIDNKTGEIIDWQFKADHEIKGKNTICLSGLTFLLKRNWGLPMAIAIGNGLATGAGTPSNEDTKLNNEFDTGRFGVRGNAFTRVSSNVITLSALWNRANVISTEITEWGLFINEQGTNVSAKNSGYLLARKAQEYTKTDIAKDIELVWIITITPI